MKRFKTEQEFITEFGIKWQSIIKMCWCSAMNYLWGMPYIPAELAGRWQVSEDMFVGVDPKEQEQYKERLQKVNLFESRIQIKNVNNIGEVLQITYRGEMGITCSFNIILNPTGNCQLLSIRNFNSLISACHTMQEIITVLRYIQSHGGPAAQKPLFFFDIREMYFSKIQGLSYTVKPIHYISSNKSEMVCGIFKL